jgi:hypothetical protein
MAEGHHLCMGARRILVANELASYRQTLAIVIRELRPHIEVYETTSEHLVICSRVTYTVRQKVANWVELYPERKPYSTFYIGGLHRAKQDVQLSDLLALCASPP